MSRTTCPSNVVWEKGRFVRQNTLLSWSSFVPLLLHMDHYLSASPLIVAITARFVPVLSVIWHIDTNTISETIVCNRQEARSIKWRRSHFSLLYHPDFMTGGTWTHTRVSVPFTASGASMDSGLVSAAQALQLVKVCSKSIPLFVLFNSNLFSDTYST